MLNNGRLAAWAALGAAIVVVLALAALLIQNVLTLLLVLAALAIAGGVGWIALTRRGIARGGAVVVCVLALTAAVVALVTRGALDELVVLAVAFVLFGYLTRTAIRQEAIGARRSSLDSVPRTPITAKKTRKILLMNPRSGDGKPEQYHLVDEAKRRGIEPILLQRGQDWRAVARDAARTADIIGMAGGDGSQALVAEIAMDAGLPYVCVPAGTRNHLALDLGLDRDDIVGALDAFSSDIRRCIDLAFVNDRIFVNNVSLGIYAEIVQSDAYRAAKMETMQKMLPDLIGPDATPFDLRYRGAAGEQHETAQLILVSNNPYQLDRLAGMGTRPKLNTGQLGIMALTIQNPAQAGEFLSLNAVGQARRFGGWIEWSAPEFEVTSGGQVAVGIDGEAAKLPSPVRFRIVPSALQVHLPPTAAGLAPAALNPGLSASGLSDLWRIAAGRS